jgi:hypothetical protein
LLSQSLDERYYDKRGVQVEIVRHHGRTQNANCDVETVRIQAWNETAEHRVPRDA